MALFIVGTPIGNFKDITERAIETLKTADAVIGEERVPVSKLLKKLGREDFREIYLLNEHSKPTDLPELVELCRNKTVALVSDCGTPGFCDPGADLVKACRKAKIDVIPVPGASSLMTMLSVSGINLRQFIFLGFLPAESSERRRALQEIKKEKRAMVIMDTPYRLEKLLSELASETPARNAFIGLSLTQESEQLVEGKLADLAQKLAGQKAEFVLLLMPLT